VPQTFLSAVSLHSIVVGNLVEGEHKLWVRYRGFNGDSGSCNRLTNTIRVVKLGVQSPRLTSERLFQFDVLTSFPAVETIIQASPDLLDWSPIETNRPAGNTFVFTETSPATNNHRFYRVVLPSGVTIGACLFPNAYRTFLTPSLRVPNGSQKCISTNVHAPPNAPNAPGPPWAGRGLLKSVSVWSMVIQHSPLDTVILFGILFPMTACVIRAGI
jgi:hypothetical protein